ncbi:MAG: putative Diguanylate cyclase/phosphodiesterase, partial [Mycobacterium sp.]|nr:putative Diguanylate cyclase/phosphodiesterase [Mycobacterium sp.]
MSGRLRVERARIGVVPRWGADLILAAVVLAVGLQLGLNDGPRGFALLAAEVALLAASMHAYRGLHRRQHDLTRVHEFVASGFGQSEITHELVLPGGGSPPSELAPGADLLDRARIFLGAECAELVVDDGYGHLTRLRLRASTATSSTSSAGVVEVDDGGAVLSDWLLLRSCEQGEAILVTDRTRDHSLRQWLAVNNTRDALLTPVRQAQGSAVLVMRNRTRPRHGTGRWRGRRSGFSHRHLALLENIAEHFTGALQTSQLLYQLRYDATHDPLTGLSNRTVLCARLDSELASHPDGFDGSPTGDPSPGLAVLLLDLDRFKEVNDTLGHHVGDLLLQVVAERLRSSLPTSATIARLGGDEFAIVLAGLADPDRDARRYAGAVIASLAMPVRLDDALLTSEVSIGIALAEHQTTSSELLRHADTAMYTAKTGSEPVVVYSAALDYGRAERLALAADLQRAIEGDQFILLYQ